MHKPIINLVATREQAERSPAAGIPLASPRLGEEHLILSEGSAFTRNPSSTTKFAVPAQSSRFHRSVYRALDVLGSLALIILLLPVMLILTVLVAVTSNSTPIFAHRRVGQGGRSFNCFKFRSMCCDAEERLERLLKEDPALRKEWMQHHKLVNDPRITPLGHFLRETSLDELPQLFNVLWGNMSFVGPRPVVQAELSHYGRSLSSYLSMKPGLTGLWQVTCRSESTYRRRVAIDRLYAQRKCYWLDLRILFATVPAVLSRKGAH